MGKIFISVLVAAVVVGNVFYISFKEVDAQQEYLQATAYRSQRVTDPQSVILRRVAAEDGSAFTPMWVRAQVVKRQAAVPRSVKEQRVAVQEEKLVVDATQEEMVTVEERAVPTVQTHKRVSNKGGGGVQLDPVSQYILTLLNNIRSKEGLVPLNVDGTLTKIAKSHSHDMAVYKDLSHVGSDGCDFTCRITSSDYGALAWAENVGFIEKSYLLESSDEIATYMVESWMGSKHHRANILNGDYTRIGIGVAKSGTDTYLTTDFALAR